MKHYTQAPLPFQGQKRRFLKQFKENLSKCPSDSIYVDLFGGSGLLSRTVKDYYPSATVVYNDYDDYSKRIATIPYTNQLIADIRVITAQYPRDKRLPTDCKDQILKRVYGEEKRRYVDYITLSANLLFSANYATNYEQLQKESFYNTVRQSDYDAAGYLDGLDIVSIDYKTVYDRYRGLDNVIFLIDPPYLSTDVGSYKNYWKLSDYLDVLTVLNNSRYFYFTSNKSHILELCQWMSSQSNYVNPFKNAKVSTTGGVLNYNSTYTDIMVFK